MMEKHRIYETESDAVAAVDLHRRRGWVVSRNGRTVSFHFMRKLAS